MKSGCHLGQRVAEAQLGHMEGEAVPALCPPSEEFRGDKHRWQEGIGGDLVLVDVIVIVKKS